MAKNKAEQLCNNENYFKYFTFLNLHQRSSIKMYTCTSSKNSRQIHLAQADNKFLLIMKNTIRLTGNEKFTLFIGLDIHKQNY